MVQSGSRDEKQPTYISPKAPDPGIPRKKASPYGAGFFIAGDVMKNPSRRWISANEFEKHASGLPRKQLCRLLRRCDRTIRDWQSGRRPIPSWTVETLRLHKIEFDLVIQQIFERRISSRAPLYAAQHDPHSRSHPASGGGLRASPQHQLHVEQSCTNPGQSDSS